MSGVSKIHARQIFDSRGNPTVEVDLVTSKGKNIRTYLTTQQDIINCDQDFCDNCLIRDIKLDHTFVSTL